MYNPIIDWIRIWWIPSIFFELDQSKSNRSLFYEGLCHLHDGVAEFSIIRPFANGILAIISWLYLRAN